MNIRVVCIGSIFTLCLLPVVLFAHSLGQSLEKQVGEYFIDIGYSSPVVTLQAGESVRFDFNLWSKDHTQAIDFATVWVRIAPAESGITFAGYLGFPEFGPLGMSYAFPDEGSYVLTARYFDGADMLGEASFPLTVLGEANEKMGSSQNIITAGIAGFVLGVLMMFFFMKHTKRY